MSPELIGTLRSKMATSPADLDDLIEGVELGDGTYGVVKKLKHAPVAVKIFRIDNEVDEMGVFQQHIIRELASLRALKGQPNIMSLFQVKHDDKSIKAYLPQYRAQLNQISDDTPLALRKSYLFQLLDGLNTMMNRDLIHRDVKPGNILVNLDGTLALTDFGLSRHIRNGLTLITDTGKRELKPWWTGKIQTRYYRAPEIYLGQRNYDHKVDSWSVGVIMLELFSSSINKLVFGGDTPRSDGEMPTRLDILHHMFEVLGTPTEATWPGVTSLPNWKGVAIPPATKPTTALSELSTHLSADPDALDLAEKLLTMCPDKRISIPEALVHPYFNKEGWVPTETPLTSPLDRVRLMTHPIDSTYIDRHFSASRGDATPLNGRMRTILVDWLLEVKRKLRITTATFFLGVGLLDRFLMKRQVSMKQLQLAGIVAMHLAALIEEHYPYPIIDWLNITAETYTRQEFLAMTNDMLESLDYDLYMSTELDYLSVLATNLPFKVHELATHLLSALVKFLKFRAYPMELLVKEVLNISAELHRYPYPFAPHPELNQEIVDQLKTMVLTKGAEGLGVTMPKSASDLLNATYKPQIGCIGCFAH